MPLEGLVLVLLLVGDAAGGLSELDGVGVGCVESEDKVTPCNTKTC